MLCFYYAPFEKEAVTGHAYFGLLLWGVCATLILGSFLIHPRVRVCIALGTKFQIVLFVTTIGSTIGCQPLSGIAMVYQVECGLIVRVSTNTIVAMFNLFTIAEWRPKLQFSFSAAKPHQCAMAWKVMSVWFGLKRYVIIWETFDRWPYQYTTNGSENTLFLWKTVVFAYISRK